MIIDFKHESNVMISELKKAYGYLDCETVIIHTIKKLIDKGFTIELIEGFLKKLMDYFENLIRAHKNSIDCTNYRYAAGFLNTLVSTPYWHSWIFSTKL